MIADLVERIVRRHPGARRESLIPILQEIQQDRGYLSPEAIVEVGRRLNLPASKVYGVATFYNQFRFRAPGRVHVQVCRGTACHVKGSARLLEAVVKATGAKPGETTRDGLFSLEVVACLGACGQAPVLVVGGEFFAGVTPERATELLNQYRRKADADGHAA
jgi:NADH-quinone oxidoreductase E subunit